MERRRTLPAAVEDSGDLMKVRRTPSVWESGLTANVLAGRYRIDALAGRGGAADVYRGLDLRLRRPVAVKVFRPGADPEMEERFADEALLLARLQHPGLITVYDTGHHEGSDFLVMELVQGVTLRRRIASGPRPLSWVCRFGAALAGALTHVHAAGIVHRDVKPSNILLDAEDKPHLTDFGISRMLDTPTHTEPRALIGTAAYLAPEQVLGKGAGTAADIYAMGLVLLECLKGELEYTGTPLEAAIARLHRPPALPPSLPGAMASLLTAMTSVEDAERPDADECAAALASQRVDPPQAAPAPRRFAVRSPGSGAHRNVLPRRRDSAPTDRTDASTGPAPTRSRRLMMAGAAALAAVLGTTLTAADGGSDAGRKQTAVPRPDPTPEPESAPRPGHSGTPTPEPGGAAAAAGRAAAPRGSADAAGPTRRVVPAEQLPVVGSRTSLPGGPGAVRPPASSGTPEYGSPGRSPEKDHRSKHRSPHSKEKAGRGTQG
ncbi:protein kinase [Streptomyces sp. NPDC056437]|uniref:serine/threonine-protein kinase n=1 Tax=Streptomyces sp. NPDC056437 TaxID=3345816 RepID=UPI003697C9F4